MRTRFRLLIAFALAAAASRALFAAPMLAPEPDGRAAAMGEATVSTAAGPVAAWGNPAGLAMAEEGACAGYHRWLAGITGSHFAGSVRWRKWGIGAFMRSAAIEDLERRDTPTMQPQGYFGARELETGIGVAYRLRAAVAVGVAAAYRYDRIEDDVRNGRFYQLGIQYQPHQSVRVGIAAQRLGAASNGQSDAMFRAGVEVRHELPLGAEIAAASEVLVQNRKLRAGLGIEAALLHILSIRGGYRFGFDSQGLTYGIGVMWRRLRMDYGIAPFANELGSTARIMLCYGG